MIVQTVKKRVLQDMVVDKTFKFKVSDSCMLSRHTSLTLSVSKIMKLIRLISKSVHST